MWQHMPPMNCLSNSNMQQSACERRAGAANGAPFADHPRRVFFLE